MKATESNNNPSRQTIQTFANMPHFATCLAYCPLSRNGRAVITPASRSVVLGGYEQ